MSWHKATKNLQDSRNRLKNAKPPVVAVGANNQLTLQKSSSLALYTTEPKGLLFFWHLPYWGGFDRKNRMVLLAQVVFVAQ